MKILTIANRKGGAGKSTCAAHIAVEATKHNKKTILIDMDPQKTLECWWEKREEEEPYLTSATADSILPKTEEIKSNGFDLCIIDTPGDLSKNTISGIKVANLVLIPSKATAPDLVAIGRTIATLKELDKQYIFLLTQVVVGTRNALQAISVLSEFGPVAPKPIVNRIAYGDAMGVGESAGQSNKEAKEELSLIWKYVEEKLFNIKKIQKKKVL